MAAVSVNLHGKKRENKYQEQAQYGGPEQGAQFIHYLSNNRFFEDKSTKKINRSGKAARVRRGAWKRRTRSSGKRDKEQRPE
jgi:hypothetical protein